MDLSCPPNWMGSVILQLLRMENKHKQHKTFFVDYQRLTVVTSQFRAYIHKGLDYPTTKVVNGC